MSRRLKVLCGILAVGVIGFGCMLAFTDWSQDVRALFGLRPLPDPVAAARPKAPRQVVKREGRVPVLGTTLLEELPRQALLITTAQERAAPVRDGSIDFSGATDAPPLQCEVDYKFNEGPAKVTIRDAKGAVVRELDLPLASLHANYIDYAKLAATVEPWCEAHFAPLLKQAGAGATSRPTTQPPEAGEDLPAPPEVEGLLAQVDPQRSFLAVRALHAAVAESGESPERLAALVRAYSQLAESTRHLYSRHCTVFFARALVYAERLVRKHPDLPLAHAARGYAYTLFGQTADARRALERARELSTPGKGELPGWAALAEDLNHFRTGRLFERAKPDRPDAALASYFALLTIEHSNLQAAVINMARLARQYNPGSLRVVNLMTDNGGVSLQHDTTELQRDAQLALLSELAKQPGVPDAVKAASAEAVGAGAGFAPAALRALLERMDAERGEAGQLLPWGAYASISRDALLVSAFRRLYFLERMLGTDPSGELLAWWPLVEAHRLAPVLAGFDRTGRVPGAGKAAREAMRQVGRDDVALRLPSIVRAAKGLTAPAPGSDAERVWVRHYEYTEDGSAYGVAEKLWVYAGKQADAVPFLAGMKGAIATSLAAIAPGHPAAVAELIVNRWPETRARAPEIERDLGGHPQVAYALARAYRSEKRYEDATRLLERAIKLSPDAPAYVELAEIYEEQGDEAKWLAVYERYLAETEDFALSHANANATIAYRFLRKRQPERALKYAKEAADSYSGWGLRVYAVCLTELGRYDEAERVERANQERYPGSFVWYRWCQTTGRGDLAAARAAAEADAKEIEAEERHGSISEVATFYALEGRRDRARECWARALQQTRGGRQPYFTIQLALQHALDGDTESALVALDAVGFDGPAELPGELAKRTGTVTPVAGQGRNKAYRFAVDEFKRCLQDPAAVPRRDGRSKEILEATNEAYRGSIAYVFGRVCEMRGKNDDAEWWYRASLDTADWTHSARPEAAAGLRRLGKPYYK